MFEAPEFPAEKIKRDITWYCCPNCGRKLFKVYPGGRVTGIQIKCDKCKQLVKVML